MEAEQARLHTILVQRAAEQRRRAAAARRAAAKKHGKSGGSKGGGGAVTRSNGFLSYPVNAPTTSEFGMRFHPIYHRWKLHSGRDFGAPCGTPVHAAAPGDIISAGWGGGYGNRIVIDHGLVSGVGLATTYNHLTSFVRRGGHVSRGQLIGYSGTTGTSTGCHLHFVVLENGNFVNPRKWM